MAFSRVNMSTLRLLIKPTIFTFGVCGTCFCGAAIVHHENLKRPFPVIKDWITTRRQQQLRYDFTQKYLNIRQDINRWANQLSVAQKIACGTIFINFLVLCAWQVKGLTPVMSRFFLSTISTTKIPLSPMILSAFSHASLLHFSFNMYALYSFAPTACALLGPEQLVGMFISAATVSSLTSTASRLLTKTPVPSLGASGALLSVIAYICVNRPDAGLLLFFIPIAAGNAIKGIIAFDLIGLIARWRYIDHAAHLGGSLFGVWYALHGERLYYKNKKFVVDAWLDMKRRHDK